MRLLVCGSRAWSDEAAVRRELVVLLWKTAAPDVVIHGAAKGADTLAAFWAVMLSSADGKGVIVLPFPADWERNGRSAGPRRNARMLAEGKPDRGLAFGALYRETNIRGGGPRGTGWPRTGTGDMVRRMLAAGLPVRWVAAPDATAVDLTEMPVPDAPKGREEGRAG